MTIRSAFAALACNQATHEFDQYVYVLAAAPLPLGEFSRDTARGIYSTVTDLARLRGWSTSQPRRTAMW
jgi:hypothetical protein